LKPIADELLGPATGLAYPGEDSLASAGICCAKD
jgi:hypothetical protein